MSHRKAARALLRSRRNVSGRVPARPTRRRPDRSPGRQDRPRRPARDVPRPGAGVVPETGWGPNLRPRQPPRGGVHDHRRTAVAVRRRPPGHRPGHPAGGPGAQGRRRGAVVDDLRLDARRLRRGRPRRRGLRGRGSGWRPEQDRGRGCVLANAVQPRPGPLAPPPNWFGPGASVAGLGEHPRSWPPLWGFISMVALGTHEP